MAAAHFFVGLGAGAALLTVPLLLAPDLNVPGRVAAFVQGPPAVARVEAPPGASRPVRGYVPGEPTPAAESPPPTLAPIVKPTAPPAPTVPAQQAPMRVGAMQRTGVIRSGGTPVAVRTAAAVESDTDPRLSDGAPVLTGQEVQVNGEGWRAVRGLGGVVGWVPSAMVAVDGG